MSFGFGPLNGVEIPTKTNKLHTHVDVTRSEKILNYYIDIVIIREINNNIKTSTFRFSGIIKLQFHPLGFDQKQLLPHYVI